MTVKTIVTVKRSFPSVKEKFHVAHPSRVSAPKSRLAKNLRTARGRAGLGQTEAAERLGVTRQTLSGWEREDARSPWPDEAALEAMAALYSTTPAVLRYMTEGGIGPVPVEWLKEPGDLGEIQTQRERAAEFRVELVKDFRVDDRVVAAAEQLLFCQEAAAFVAMLRGSDIPSQADRTAAMTFLVPAIRQHFRSVRDQTSTIRLHVKAEELGAQIEEGSAARPTKGATRVNKAADAKKRR